ncbi:phosphopantetheine-binding protein [Zoogloea sp.]|uniref:acyl carrier protein n=1 Tax=Zoogloea sp. TaxID=49181 RepID=UPI0014163099|nr:MAG: acyl carrier protein [Zoogloea sp.]
METLTVIREFLHDRLEVDPAAIQPETTLEELKIDSLLLVELIFECEEKFNVIFERDVPTPKNIGELITIVDEFIAEAQKAKQG